MARTTLVRAIVVAAALLALRAGANFLDTNADAATKAVSDAETDTVSETETDASS